MYTRLLFVEKKIHTGRSIYTRRLSLKGQLRNCKQISFGKGNSLTGSVGNFALLSLLHRIPMGKSAAKVGSSLGKH